MKWFIESFLLIGLGHIAWTLWISKLTDFIQSSMCFCCCCCCCKSMFYYNRLFSTDLKFILKKLNFSMNYSTLLCSMKFIVFILLYSSINIMRFVIFTFSYIEFFSRTNIINGNSMFVLWFVWCFFSAEKISINLYDVKFEHFFRIYFYLIWNWFSIDLINLSYRNHLSR